MFNFFLFPESEEPDHDDKPLGGAGKDHFSNYGTPSTLTKRLNLKTYPCLRAACLKWHLASNIRLSDENSVIFCEETQQNRLHRK